MYLDQHFIKELATEIGKEVAKEVMKSIRATDEPKSEYVGATEAARILGITPGRLRDIKDRFVHIKQGSKRQCRLMFQRESLLKNYAK